jgi:hypothetical protein
MESMHIAFNQSRISIPLDISKWWKKTQSFNTFAASEIIKSHCQGVNLGGKAIKSFLFSTDMALIENYEADAVLAVYPFPPSAKIIKSIIDFSEKPVICGVGGGLTQGKVAVEMAKLAEDAGAAALIVNQPFKNKDIELIKISTTLPMICSISHTGIDFRSRIEAGVDIFHITGGKATAAILEHLCFAAPGYPLLATGGKEIETVASAIAAGADGIVLTPPSSGELFKSIKDRYRSGYDYIKR